VITTKIVHEVRVEKPKVEKSAASYTFIFKNIAAGELCGHFCFRKNKHPNLHSEDLI
jgi:hypothetical protein